MKSQILAKLKTPQTNLKYILIVVILAFLAGGGILSYLKHFNREIISLIQFPKITTPERRREIRKLHEKGEILYEEIVYKNERFGFEFRYPKTYAEDKCAQVKEEENFILIGACIELVIFESNIPNLTEYVKKEVSERELDVEAQENLIIGGEEAIKIKFYYDRGYGESVFLMKNGKIYYFNRVDEGECPIAFQEGPSEWTVFDRILQSFRFLR